MLLGIYQVHYTLVRIELTQRTSVGSMQVEQILLFLTTEFVSFVDDH